VYQSQKISSRSRWPRYELHWFI